MAPGAGLFHSLGKAEESEVKTINNFRPYLFFFLIWVVFSYPFFFQGKIPAPLDFLVNFYAPWDAYYDAPIKNSALSDVVSQIIPWKIFNAEELKSGRIPLWNSYNLAGTPHLGNWQSGVLYPTTLLFLFLPTPLAWSLHILLQPLAAGIFMILFLRSLKLSGAASLIGATAFAYGGFMTTWFEWGTLGHALLWLPLALYGIQGKKEEGRRKREFILTIFALTMSLLAGHPQTSFYVFLTTIGYYLYRNWGDQSKQSLFPVSCFLFLVPLLLAALQVLPGVQVYLNSARSLVDGTSWAKAFLIPVSGLLTFLAPDFFGNPVTRNSWSNFSYVEMQGYVGILTFVLSLVSVVSIKRPGLAAARPGLIKFLIGMVVAALVLATNNPAANWLIDLRIPIISTSSPARLMGVIGFGLAVLGAFGFETFIKLLREGKVRELVKPAAAIAVILGGMWLWNNPVSRRNLILPSLLMSAVIISVFIIPVLSWNLSRIKSGTSHRFRVKHGMTLIFYFLLLTSIFDIFRFHHKFTPYMDISMWYPQLPVLTELGNRPGRSFGLLDGNLNLPFRIYSLDGYDPLVNSEYVKLTYPAEELAKRNRVTGPYLPKGNSKTIDLISRLGVKWMVDSATPGGAPWDLRLWEYGDQFQAVWKDEKYQILLNIGAVSEIVGPNSWLRVWQYRLFILGSGVSGMTMITLGLTRKLWH